MTPNGAPDSPRATDDGAGAVPTAPRKRWWQSELFVPIFCAVGLPLAGVIVILIAWYSNLLGR